MKRRIIFIQLLLVTITLNIQAQWNIQTVTNTGDAGAHSDIAVDSDGYPHIAFIENTSLMHSYWNGLGWQTEMIGGYYYEMLDCSITIDQFDVIFIAVSYWQPNSNYYARAFKKVPEQFWETLPVIGSQIGELSICCIYDVILLQTIPHVAYGPRTTDYPNGLVHAYFDPNSANWISEEVDDNLGVGYHNDIVANVDGSLHISYYDPNGGDLKYAYNNGSGWNHIIVDGLNSHVGLYPSIDIDSNGDIQISYYDQDSGNLLHATVIQN